MLAESTLRNFARSARTIFLYPTTRTISFDRSFQVDVFRLINSLPALVPALDPAFTTENSYEFRCSLFSYLQLINLDTWNTRAQSELLKTFESLLLVSLTPSDLLPWLRTCWIDGDAWVRLTHTPGLLSSSTMLTTIHDIAL